MTHPRTAICVGCTVIAVICGMNEQAYAQVRGSIVDESGNPIAEATITSSKASATTTEDGTFAIDASGPALAFATGFVSKTVVLKNGMIIVLNADEEETIEIKAKKVEQTQPPSYELSTEDIRTMPGAMGDVLRAVTVLPAASRIPYSFGGLVLRGMSPRDSRVFVDGVPIPIAFHFGGLVSVLPTSVVDSMRVTPSGFDVSLGRTQGGAIELTTREISRDKVRVGGMVSLLHSAISAEGPLLKDGAIGIALRRSYFDLAVRPFIEDAAPLPNYTDGQLRVAWGDANRRGRLQIYLLGSLDRVANSEDTPKPNDPDSDDHFAGNLGFVRIGANYRLRKKRRLITVAPWVGTNLFSVESKSYMGSLEQTSKLARNWYQFGGRAEVLQDHDHGYIRAGLDIGGGYLGLTEVTRNEVTSEDEEGFPQNAVGWADAAIWVEARRHWRNDKISIKPGLRLDRFGLGEQWALDPRINAHFALSGTAKLRLGLGRFHQPPSPAHFDEFADNLKAKSSYVDQSSIAMEWKPEQNLNASATVFWNEGRRTLINVETENGPSVPRGFDLIFLELLEEQLGFYGFQANTGRQRSYGFESSIQYKRNNFRVLANYTWSRSLRRYDPKIEPGWVPYGLDQPLRFNALVANRFGQWNLGARITVVSGNPVDLIPVGTPFDPEREAKQVKQRMPTFWQIDFRADRSWQYNWGQVSLFFDIQNATNRRNIETQSSELGLDDRYRTVSSRGIPIIPLIGVEFLPTRSKR